MEHFQHRNLTIAAAWLARQNPGSAALNEVGRAYRLNRLDMAQVNSMAVVIRGQDSRRFQQSCHSGSTSRPPKPRGFVSDCAEIGLQENPIISATSFGATCAETYESPLSSDPTILRAEKYRNTPARAKAIGGAQ